MGHPAVTRHTVCAVCLNHLALIVVYIRVLLRCHVCQMADVASCCCDARHGNVLLLCQMWHMLLLRCHICRVTDLLCFVYIIPTEWYIIY